MGLPNKPLKLTAAFGARSLSPSRSLDHDGDDHAHHGVLSKATRVGGEGTQPACRFQSWLRTHGATDLWFQEYASATEIIAFARRRGFSERRRFEYQGTAIVVLGKSLLT